MVDESQRQLKDCEVSSRSRHDKFSGKSLLQNPSIVVVLGQICPPFFSFCNVVTVLKCSC